MSAVTEQSINSKQIYNEWWECVKSLESSYKQPSESSQSDSVSSWEDDSELSLVYLAGAGLGVWPDTVIALLPLDSLQGGDTAVRSDGPHCPHSSVPQLLQGPQNVPVKVLRGSPWRSPLDRI